MAEYQSKSPCQYACGLERLKTSFNPDRMPNFSKAELRSLNSRDFMQFLEPDSHPRLSIALYYFTATWEAGGVLQSTVFKPRPGTDDVRSHDATMRVVREIVPPAVYRKSVNILRRLKNLCS